MQSFSPRSLSSSESGHSPTSLTIFFIFFGLFIGILIRQFHRQIPIPYTPFLLILGALSTLFSPHIPILSESISLISEIDPTGILLIFIPILIFESSFKSDFHMFKRSLKSILLLAGPGVIISFAFLAFTMKIILRYPDSDLSWSSALMLGSILAATDPVAIVALLKTLRAPHFFSTIVEGESLLNDGTGVVFFSLFANIASGKEITVGLGIATFIFLCLGGVLLGLIFSFFTSLWLKRILNDAVLSITLTITASYLLFWVSETFRANFTSEVKVGVSGILALCTLGLCLSAFGKTKISNRVESSLHSVIQWAQYTSETLIFLLSGVLAGKVLFYPDRTIRGEDWAKMIGFFVLMNVGRGLVVILLSPFLKNSGGYKMGFKELFILSYGGLRGALGLSLALTVNGDEDSFPKRTRELVLFYVAGSATLSLLINGTTTGFIVKKIKMIKEFPVKGKVFRNLIREIKGVNMGNYEKLREENPAAFCDWEIVRKITGIDIHDPNLRREETGIGSPRNEAYKVKLEEDLRLEARYRLLNMFKGLIWERYEDGELEAYGAEILSKAVNVSSDSIETRVNMFDFLHKYFVKPGWLATLSKLSSFPLIGRYCKNLMIDHMVFIYDVTTSLEEIVEELKVQAEEVLPISKNIVDEVLNEFEDEKKDAVSYLHKLEDEFREVIKYITTKRYVSKILASESKFITERFKTGAIEEKEYDNLLRGIDKTLDNLPNLIKIKWEAPTFSNLILSFPALSILTKDQTKKILETSKKSKKFREGELLFEEGKPFDCIYLITRGEVELIYGSHKSSKKGVGSLVSFFNLVMFDNVSRMTCVAKEKEVEVQRLDLDSMRQLMKENKKFEENVYKGALTYLRFIKPEEAKPLINMKSKHIKELARSGELVYFGDKERIRLPCGGFILKGRIKAKHKIYEEYSMVGKGLKEVVGDSEGVVLKFHTTLMKESALPSSKEKETENTNEAK